tara:strand:+ start:99 stop:1298 length:1200 start_codon:yes stop_codon:yes gene_type:complete
MEKKIQKYLFFYLVILFVFSIFFLNLKHNVLNDSTISEWLINYSGGFTKRGIIGQISIYFANLFLIDLRVSILIFQILIVGTYYILVFYFLRNLPLNRIFLLIIFTPIFLLYPVAEIEVLARKETFLFAIFILYLNIPINKKKLQNGFKLVFFPISVLIWEPIVFLFLILIALDIIQNKIETFNTKLIKKLLVYLPTIIIALFIALNPISFEEHEKMATYLNSQFNETCYMSCARLITTSTILQNFQHNVSRYSFEVFLRYFLIISIGFGPLFIMLFNSSLKNKNLLFFKRFKNLFYPFLIILSPTILLFAMGGDWGRWVNILYVFSVLTYLSLYKNNLIITDEKQLKNNFLNKLKTKTFVVLFIFFCFGWNPKTIITGDVASFPGYRIPYKAIKILSN